MINLYPIEKANNDLIRNKLGTGTGSGPRVKYSRILYLLSFILVSCVVYLIASMFFLLPATRTATTTTTNDEENANMPVLNNHVIINQSYGINSNTITENNGFDKHQKEPRKAATSPPPPPPKSMILRNENTPNESNEDANKNHYYLPPVNNSKKMEQSISWKELDEGSIFSQYRRKNKIKQIPTALPLPIFVMNMPKSGSTTLHQYFTRGMGGRVHSIHHAYNTKFMDPTVLPYVHPDMKNTAAACMAHNFIHDRPLIHGCGGFSVWTDAGAVVYLHETEGVTLDFTDTTKPAPTKQQLHHTPNQKICFYPGVHALQNIEKYYPYSTILHLPRNATSWVQSSTGWSRAMGTVGTNSSHEYEESIQKRKDTNTGISPRNDNNNNNDKNKSTKSTKKKGATLLDRYEDQCNGFDGNTFIGPPTKEEKKIKKMKGDTSTNKEKKIHKQKSEDEWMEWYDVDYTQRIRKFAADHPTLTYFESPLEDPETPIRLERATGIPTQCFGHSLKTSQRLKMWEEKNAKKNDNNNNNSNKSKKGIQNSGKKKGTKRTATQETR